mmetsp:Transcript_46729/g.93690  ORF Transcript_46729/g.93690 Transcript_46729/m.93690 type:complete len:270 (-) Transcript_46729:61-870(-)
MCCASEKQRQRSKLVGKSALPRSVPTESRNKANCEKRCCTMQRRLSEQTFCTRILPWAYLFFKSHARGPAGRFKKASAFIKEYRQADRSGRRFNREAKMKNPSSSEDIIGKLVLAVRIKGMTTADPKTKRVLKALRLHRIDTAAFVKGDSATAKQLRLVAPYIVYGVPELKTVRELVLKRGFTDKGQKRQALSSNQLVEDHLGEKGMVCLEDLIHELYTVGPNYKAANDFIMPFKLHAPKPEDKPAGITDRPRNGGPSANINALVGIMN